MNTLVLFGLNTILGHIVLRVTKNDVTGKGFLALLSIRGILAHFRVVPGIIDRVLL